MVSANAEDFRQTTRVSYTWELLTPEENGLEASGSVTVSRSPLAVTVEKIPGEGRVGDTGNAMATQSSGSRGA